MSAAPRLLLTGGTGFLGSKFAGRLAADFRVAALKRRASRTDRLRRVPVTFHDVEDGIEAAFADGIEVVLHAATCYGRAGESLAAIFEANTAFPLRVLTLAATRGVRLFVNVDTGLPAATSAYSLSKSQFRDWGRFAAAQGGIRFLNLRLQHFYGAGDDPGKFTAHVIRACLEGAPELALTPGEQRRDFLHVDDAVEAVAAALAAARRSSETFVEYEVGSGEAVSIRQFAELVKRLSGARTHLAFGARPYRDGEPMLSVADVTRLRALGWAPRLTLEDGLRRTLREERAA